MECWGPLRLPFTLYIDVFGVLFGLLFSQRRRCSNSLRLIPMRPFLLRRMAPVSGGQELRTERPPGLVRSELPNKSNPILYILNRLLINNTPRHWIETPLHVAGVKYHQESAWVGTNNPTSLKHLRPSARTVRFRPKSRRRGFHGWFGEGKKGEDEDHRVTWPTISDFIKSERDIAVGHSYPLYFPI